jgi:hypothetical protein
LKALRKIAVTIVILILAFSPLLFVLPAFGQVTDPVNTPAKYTYMYTAGISMQIDAPEGFVFNKVVWADFGMPYFDDDFKLNSDPSCTTAAATSAKLLSIINGKNSVEISADPAIYGNPCPNKQQRLAYMIEAIFPNPYPRNSPEPSQTPTESPTSIAEATEPPTPLPSSTATPTPSQSPVEPSVTATPTQEPKPHKSSSSNPIKWVELSTEARKKGQEVIVATVIVSQIATTASMIRKRK